MNILDIPMNPNKNEAGASSIRGYLKNLLLCMWDDPEAFSGKRPFGNSGWEYELYSALIVAGIVKGTLDEEGYIEQFQDRVLADQLITDAIKNL